MELHIPVSAGELLDKVSILRIKEARIDDEKKLANVRRELKALWAVVENLPVKEAQLEQWLSELAGINEALWKIEDDIRGCEARRDFGDAFIALARAVYRRNDERSRIKRQINIALGSSIVEEKSYVDPN